MGDPLSDLFDINPPDQAASIPLDDKTKGLMESQRQAAIGSTPQSESAHMRTDASGLMQDQESINRNLSSLGVRDTSAMSAALQNRAQNVYGNYQRNQDARNDYEGAGKSFERQTKNYENQHIQQALVTQAWQRQVQHETDVLNTRYAVVGSILGGGMGAFGSYMGRRKANLENKSMDTPMASNVTASDWASDGNTRVTTLDEGTEANRSFEGSERQYRTDY
jgi:hypothetical protein